MKKIIMLPTLSAVICMLIVAISCVSTGDVKAGNTTKDTSNTKPLPTPDPISVEANFVFNVSNAAFSKNVDFTVGADASSVDGNYAADTWGTNSEFNFSDTYAGKDCWSAKFTGGWSTCLAVMGDVNDPQPLAPFCVDFTKCTAVHFLVAVENAKPNNLKVKLVAAAGSHEIEIPVTSAFGYDAAVKGWQSIDIPLSAFKGYDPKKVDINTSQFAIFETTNAKGVSIYITDYCFITK